MRILFVCTGNICRSPVAERMLRQLAVGRGLHLDVSSAGTRALNGQPMHPESRRVLQERGIDPGGFQSRMLTPRLVAEAEVVLGMTRDHRAAARQLAPIKWKRMFALREVAFSSAADSSFGVGKSASLSSVVNPTDPSLDIADPIGKESVVFDEVAESISVAVEGLISWIMRIERDSSPWPDS